MSTLITHATTSVTYEWTITLSKDSDKKSIFFPSFNTVDGDWYLRLKIEDSSVNLFLYAANVKSSPTVRYSLWACQEEKLLESQYIVYHFRNNGAAYGCGNIINLPSEAKKFTFGVKILAPSNTPTSPACLDTLSTIFNDAETSDVEFHIQDRCIYAHKAILMARSVYFDEKYFDEKFDETTTPKDSQRQRIEVSEDYESFHLLLYYLYTGCVSIPSITVEAKKVLEISSKYGVVELHLAAEENEIRQLSKENISDILFNYGYKYDDLKKECIKSIKNNYKDIRDTKEFRNGLIKLANEGGNGEFIADLFFAVNN